MAKAPTAKVQHRVKLVEYLADPDNDWPNRGEMSQKVLGLNSPSAIYQYFTSDVISEIEFEALELRRKRYARYSSIADKALVGAMAKGDPAALKLFYQRLEGWNPAQKVESKVEVSGELTLADILGDESGSKG